MKLSPFKKSDKNEIKNLFINVFTESENQSEGKLIGELASNLMSSTSSQDLFAYVAIEDKQIIGCIFFSRLLFDTPIDAFILSPVAIHTKYQGQGIGQKLINFGIEQLKQTGVKLIFTYGDPNFYSKVGFIGIIEEIAKAPFKLSQPEGWLCQSLDGSEIKPLAGTARCVEALSNPELW